ncbi:MAG: DUF4178 domain-containing protein [Burkholderiales bacterium]|nr:DUF4178 domain-containing protein [Burkholderiales bacterium]
MATSPTPQRVYRAACPNCGAPVEFRSAAAPFAVCSFCRSTVVRAGDQLRKIGESAEVFDDHTPLQLGSAGKHQGANFTIVGRLQYRYGDGTWNEWHALFESGPELQKSGWLSDDNGRYVVAFDAPLQTPVPPAENLQPGAPLTVNGESWSVASVVAAKLIAAQGELPRRPNLEKGFVVADLRSSRGEVGTLDYTEPARPMWSVGRSVALSDLALTGLSEAGEKTLSGRTLQCPSCGAALEVKLETTQSIVCHQCKSVVDVSQGVGGDLAHYAQDNGQEPQIPLGTVGTIALGGKAALPWQVVGYVERCEIPESSEDEQTFWREYLLYHRIEGFAFIVDAEDGWSWAIPITGAPQSFGDSVKHEGVLYKKLYDYTGQVTYVLGEFYWRLTRDQRTANTDYAGTGSASSKRLNRERTESEGTQEIVWSAGEALSADVIQAAFRLGDDKRAGLQRDALPTSLGSASKIAKIIFWGFLFFLVLILFRCGDDHGKSDCNEVMNTFGEASQEYQSCLNNQRSGSGYRSGGGAFGGFSSGGGHK